MLGFSEKPKSNNRDNENTEQPASSETFVEKLVRRKNQEGTGEIASMQRFQRQFPEKFRQLNEIVKSRFSKQELYQAVKEFNNNPGMPKQGRYSTFHVSLDSINEILTVKFFENGRVRISLPSGETARSGQNRKQENHILETSEEGPTFRQLVKKYNLTDGNRAAFEKTKIFTESPTPEGAIVHGILDGDVERGESITFRGKDAKISNVRKIEEREGKVFIKTSTSEYVFGELASE